MEYNNYVTLIILNVAAGHLLLSNLIWQKDYDGDSRHWAAPFFVVGFLSFITGLHMIWTWPLPGSFNIAFGEPALVFGAIMIGIAWTLYKNLSLEPLAIYALLAGIAAFVIGAQIINLGLTWSPQPLSIGFFFSGFTGVLAWPVIRYKDNNVWRISYTLVSFLAALMWSIGIVSMYWTNIREFAAW